MAGTKELRVNIQGDVTILTHWEWSKGMETGIWVNIDWGNGMLPDSPKSLPEPMLTYHQWSFVAFTKNLPERLKIGIHEMRFKPDLLGAKELTSNLAARRPSEILK